MKNVLVMGALGQIGSELTPVLKSQLGDSNVIASDIRATPGTLFETIQHDCTKGKQTQDIVSRYRIDTIYYLPAILSSRAEEKTKMAWDVNLNGLYQTLEVAREKKCSVFFPSTIGVFGVSTPKDGTPQETIMRPSTIYGVTKVAGELLCDYYHKRFGVDTRGVRFPGIVSYKTKPGGGTSDFSVEIYYEAIKNKSYECYLNATTMIDIIYMPDAIEAAIQIMLSDPDKLKYRNAFNITAMSLSPEKIAASIKKRIPEFSIRYAVDTKRQAIADSWPNFLDDSEARCQWGWDPKYDLDKMTDDMLKNLQK